MDRCRSEKCYIVESYRILYKVIDGNMSKRRLLDAIINSESQVIVVPNKNFLQFCFVFAVFNFFLSNKKHQLIVFYKIIIII